MAESNQSPSSPAVESYTARTIPVLYTAWDGREGYDRDEISLIQRERFIPRIGDRINVYQDDKAIEEACVVDVEWTVYEADDPESLPDYFEADDPRDGEHMYVHVVCTYE